MKRDKQRREDKGLIVAVSYKRMVRKKGSQRVMEVTHVAEVLLHLRTGMLAWERIGVR
jgi:hypothetical protein